MRTVLPDVFTFPFNPSTRLGVSLKFAVFVSEAPLEELQEGVAESGVLREILAHASRE